MGSGSGDGEHPSGVIVTGCDGGVMQVYDAAKILKNEDAIVLSKNKHTGPVRALDFNSFRVSQVLYEFYGNEFVVYNTN